MFLCIGPVLRVCTIRLYTPPRLCSSDERETSVDSSQTHCPTLYDPPNTTTTVLLHARLELHISVSTLVPANRAENLIRTDPPSEPRSQGARSARDGRVVSGRR